MKTNVLLEGEIGSGKTRSLCTLLPEYIDERGRVAKGAGLTPFVITLEPGIAATLGRNLCGSPDAPSPAIHYHYLKPLDIEWHVIQKYAKLVNTLPLDSVLKINDPDKPRYTQFLDLFDICANFTCHGCGEAFGPVDHFDEDRAIAFDSLTGLTTVARHNAVGGKPILSQPEYNPVMELIEAFLKLWWGQTKCSAILLSHIDREINPVSGLRSITVHTIGQKLAPRIVKIPDEIIMAERDDRGNYTWTTSDTDNAVLKSRRLPRAAGLAPDFAQLFKE